MSGVYMCVDEWNLLLELTQSMTDVDDIEDPTADRHVFRSHDAFFRFLQYIAV